LEKQSKEDSVKTAEVRAEESILRVGTADLGLAALGAPEESFLKNRLVGTPPIMMVPG
jgi:hypothetical protein